MNTRVLVTYATKYGATAEIAEKIGQALRQAGLNTNKYAEESLSYEGNSPSIGELS